MESLTIDTLIEKLKTLRESHGNLPIEVPDASGEGQPTCANTTVVIFPRKWNTYLEQWDVIGPAQCVRISNEY